LHIQYSESPVKYSPSGELVNLNFILTAPHPWASDVCHTASHLTVTSHKWPGQSRSLASVLWPNYTPFCSGENLLILLFGGQRISILSAHNAKSTPTCSHFKSTRKGHWLWQLFSKGPQPSPKISPVRAFPSVLPLSLKGMNCVDIERARGLPVLPIPQKGWYSTAGTPPSPIEPWFCRHHFPSPYPLFHPTGSFTALSGKAITQSSRSHHCGALDTWG
jgi:hypothetical protein